MVARGPAQTLQQLRGLACAGQLMEKMESAFCRTRHELREA